MSLRSNARRYENLSFTAGFISVDNFLQNTALMTHDACRGVPMTLVGGLVIGMDYARDSRAGSGGPGKNASTCASPTGKFRS